FGAAATSPAGTPDRSPPRGGTDQRCKTARRPPQVTFPDASSSDARASRDDGRARRGRELLEVVAEHPRELAGLAVVRGGVAPGRARVEERVVDPGHAHRHLEAEERVGP